MAPPDPDPPLRWLFVDMNSYFASVEQQFDPELRGRPVGVVPVDTDATCCIAASAEAKARGVATGTPVREARRRCPGLVIRKARPAFYVEVHRRILDAADTVAPVHEVQSIDEFSVRLDPTQRSPDAARRLAQRVKDAIADGVGTHLRCSAGVAATPLLAKIAAGLHKPDGLTLLPVAELPGALAHLELPDLTGIGGGMAARLRRAGVDRVEQLWALTPGQMRGLWGGAPGLRYHDQLHGIDDPPAATRRHSMGHAHVLPPELRTPAGARGVMVRLLHKAAHRLRHHGYVAHRLHASILHEPGPPWHDEIDLPGSQDTLTIVQHFARLWDRRAARAAHGSVGRPKKVAVTLSGLIPEAAATGLLFEPHRRRERLGHVLDRVNRRFGHRSLYLAAMHDARHAMDDKIAFGRVPDEACPV